jgi:hypothetical protein
MRGHITKRGKASWTIVLEHPELLRSQQVARLIEYFQNARQEGQQT